MRISSCHPDRKYHAKGLCSKCYKDKYYAEHREKLIAQMVEYDAEHRKEKKAYNAKYGTEHLEEKTAYMIKYYKEHRKERAKYERERRKNDVQFRLAAYLRSRVGEAVRRGRRAGSAVRDLGCSVAQFKLFIENQWDEGMTWDNYGEWHLDHVLPLSSFDLTDRSQFITACNWLNYQPLWALDNISKGAKI